MVRVRRRSAPCLRWGLHDGQPPGGLSQERLDSRVTALKAGPEVSVPSIRTPPRPARPYRWSPAGDDLGAGAHLLTRPGEPVATAAASPGVSVEPFAEVG